MTDTARPVPLEEAALLLIDIQDSFKVGPRWERRGNLAFERNVTRLLDAWRAAGLPVYFILSSDADPGFEITSPHYKVMDFLTRREDEPLVHKTTRNSFTSSNLQSLLVPKGVRRLVITGIQMEQCCETTTRVAADLGYDVDFVLEATQTFPIPHVVDGKVVDELGTDEIARRTAFVLRKRFARIATVDDLLEEIGEKQQKCA